MADYTVKMDFSGLLMGLEQVNAELASRVHGAIGMAAQKIHEEWANRVMKAPGIWMPERHAYVHSLRWDYTGEFSAEVWTDNQTAYDIEHGRPQKDLKRMLQTSSKVRQSVKGKYLIIPMRHNTPGNTAHAGAMPPHVYQAARQLQPSKITGMGTRTSATGATVAQAKYQWGERLPAGLTPKMKPHHTTDIHAGMVRMNTSAGGAKSSAYLTFRIMGEWQSGKWLVPAKPGLYIARQLAGDIQADIEQVVESAVS